MDVIAVTGTALQLEDNILSNVMFVDMAFN